MCVYHAQSECLSNTIDVEFNEIHNSFKIGALQIKKQMAHPLTLNVGVIQAFPCQKRTKDTYNFTLDQKLLQRKQV